MKLSPLVLLINLEKRTDRLLRMQNRLAGIIYTRIDAVDIESLSDEIRIFESNLSAPELACSASHIKALKTFLKTDHEACIVLEDDVLFSDDFKTIVNSGLVLPDDAYVLKLETFKHKIFVSRRKFRVDKFKYVKMQSGHYGAAAYMTSRNGAKHIIAELIKQSLPVDDVIFKDMLGCKEYGHALQLLPACCIQENLDNQEIDSDISEGRNYRCHFQSSPYVKQNKIYKEMMRAKTRLVRFLKGQKRIRVEFKNSKT